MGRIEAAGSRTKSSKEIIGMEKMGGDYRMKENKDMGIWRKST